MFSFRNARKTCEEASFFLADMICLGGGGTYWRCRPKASSSTSDLGLGILRDRNLRSERLTVLGVSESCSLISASGPDVRDLVTLRTSAKSAAPSGLYQTWSPGLGTLVTLGPAGPAGLVGLVGLVCLSMLRTLTWLMFGCQQVFLF